MPVLLEDRGPDVSNYVGNLQLTETEHGTAKKERQNGHNVMGKRGGEKTHRSNVHPNTSCTVPETEG